ncbi:MAG: SCO family protein [Bdellovibrionales bacterium]|nr:SCO family protein [Bdellovibrionales bacterium]
MNWTAPKATMLKASLLLCLTSLISYPSFAVDVVGDPNKTPLELQDVGVKEHLGGAVDLGLTFTSGEDGKVHPLKDFIDPKKPTIVNMVYFECPMLCTMVLNGVNDGMIGLDWTIGNQFNVLTVSIDPKETSNEAQAKKAAYVDHYLAGRTEQIQTEGQKASVRSGWHFVTGTEANVKLLSDQLGFSFKYDKIQKQFAHPAVTFILTPSGQISRYLYGVTYRPRDLRLALLEASQGKIGNVFDRLLMFCYHYDPAGRGYSIQVVQLMKLGAAATVGLFGGWLMVFWTRQRKGKKANDNVPA